MYNINLFIINGGRSGQDVGSLCVRGSPERGVGGGVDSSLYLIFHETDTADREYKYNIVILLL